MSGGVNRNAIEARRVRDMARALAQLSQVEPISFELMKVYDFVTVDAPNYRYRYSVKRAQVGPAPNYVAALTGNTLAEYAISVSELSNAGTTVSYGILKANIPAGFAPQPIPTGTYVLCVPHRLTDGTLIWLIVNTQAIDGVCA